MSWVQAIPAIISAITAGASAFTGKKAEQGSTYTKGQRSYIDEILQNLKGGGIPDIQQNQGFQGGQEWLNSLFNDPEFFNRFQAPLQRQFQEQTLPEISNRFAGQGSHGSFGGGYERSLGRAGADFQTNLAALQGGMQQQGVNQALQYGQQPINNFMQLLQTALQPTMNQYKPATNPLSGIASGFTSGAAQGYGQQFGNWMAPSQQSTPLPTSTQPGAY